MEHRKRFLQKPSSSRWYKNERGNVGTTVIHPGKSDIDTFELIHPGERMREAFAKIAEPLTDETVLNTMQACTLCQIRDTLLPKLISGEIRLRDSEKMAEAKA